jgi:ABC-type cobalamin/Fe3+-siderophores transport system ATPase subunit
MRLHTVQVRNQPPLKCFDVTDLSSVVVVAGPNGVGKTRLLNAILSLLRNPGAAPSQSRLVVSATHDRERQEWGLEQLDSAVADQAAKLRTTVQRQQRRGNWKSSAFHFDSTRQFSQVQQLAWTWNFTDPAEEMVGWDLLFNPFQQRFQDTIHAIYRMLGHHRAEIARRAIELQRAGEKHLPLDFPDPLAPFRDAFGLLLGPKQLADIDINNPQIRYIQDGTTLGIDSLSSGEKEAFNIVFDLLLRRPEDCVIFFDEPELHLHPELAFRLLQTLQVVGQRNQFVLFTHSADIISSAIEHSVVFIAPRSDEPNQAVTVKATDDTAAALRHLGQGLGVISLGRRIVLIEGSDSSIDRETYGALVQDRFPTLVLAPSGSRGTIISFHQVVQDVLQRTLWGVEFFMLADRDSSLPEGVLRDLEAQSSGRLRFLPRLHVENYFLHERTIAAAFGNLVPASDWRRNPDAISEKLRNLATAAIPLAVNRWLSTQLRSLVGELDISVKGVQGMNRDQLVTATQLAAKGETTRIGEHFSESELERRVRERWDLLEASLHEDTWKALFPGKMLFVQFAATAQVQQGMLRSAFLAASRSASHEPFADILSILEGWK